MGGKEERGPAGMSQATGRGGFHCWEGIAGGEGSRLTGGKEGFCCARVYRRQGMTAEKGQRGPHTLGFTGGKGLRGWKT